MMTRMLVVGVLLVCTASACRSKSRPASGEASASAALPSSNLTDLSPSLDAVRSLFNARKKEARFLTLLSPA